MLAISVSKIIILERRNKNLSSVHFNSVTNFLLHEWGSVPVIRILEATEVAVADRNIPQGTRLSLL